MTVADDRSPPATKPIRNRIKCHRKVRAGDLVPHELNYRFHSERQRAALGALYEEIGFARSLLAYELPDGKLKLTGGHLRRDMDPDMEVDVEVLDLTDEEARVLLPSIDPLADLALVQDQIHERLMDLTPTDSPDLEVLWKEAQETIDSAFKEDSEKDRSPPCELEQQFMVLIPCRDEEHQVELLERFQREGLACKAVLG
jgi:hypothetical protein